MILYWPRQYHHSKCVIQDCEFLISWLKVFVANRRDARCAVASNAVKTLCKLLERHAAALILNMLKTNAAAWRLHFAQCVRHRAVGRLWQRCRVLFSAVSAPRARCKHALYILYLDLAFAMHFDYNFDYNISNHKMYSNIIILMNTNCI